MATKIVTICIGRSVLGTPVSQWFFIQLPINFAIFKPSLNLSFILWRPQLFWCVEGWDLLNQTRKNNIQSRTPEKMAKNHVILTWNFPKTFPTKMKSTKCPAKEKRGEKSEKRGEERKRKVNVKTAVSLLNPQTLLSAHTQTSEANILHLDRKAAKCSTCKWLYGTFSLFIAQQWPENSSTSFKTRSLAKFLGANGLM